MKTLQNHRDFQSGGNFHTVTERGMSVEHGSLSMSRRQRLKFRNAKAARNYGPGYLRGKSCAEKVLQEPA